VDVVRDPRWGRVEETYGEDPYLISVIGLAAVRGFQGDSLPLAPDKVFATLKHFTGHGQPENGTNVGPAPYAERTLRENFFPPFERAVKELPVRSVMPSYNEIDGVPSHANRWLLTDILRKEWGYKGSVQSDYFAIKELIARHKLTDDLGDTAVMAMNAGVDVELPDGEAYALIPELVKAYAEYKDQGVVVLGVSIDDSAETLRDYGTQKAMNYPSLLLTEEVDEAYGPIVGVPITFFIGRDGQIALKHLGPVTAAQVEREIKALL